MLKKNRITGSRYKIGVHPLKQKVNEWIANLTRTVVRTNDDPWALILESEATLTIKCLTNHGRNQIKNETNSSEDWSSPETLSPIIKESNIVIPQPDCDQLNKIQNSHPSISIFPKTSHELLSDLSNQLSDNLCDTICLNPMVGKLIPSKINDELDISDKSSIEESTPKALLCKRGWPGWFDLIWLDYCGKVSSGNVGKQRKHDLEMIFSSGMLAGKRSKNNDESTTNSKCNALWFSVLAITMSNRATPLRYPNEQLDLLFLYILELAEKYGFICDTTLPSQESNFLRSKEKSKLIANVGVAGVINYFITTPMTTVALVIGPKICIPTELQLKVSVPNIAILQEIISKVYPPSIANQQRSYQNTENEDEDMKPKINEQNINYIPGNKYRICDTQTYGGFIKKVSPLWEAEFICATEFVNLCLQYIKNQSFITTDVGGLKEKDVFHFVIVGQDNRLMPLYQAFLKIVQQFDVDKERNHLDYSVHLLLSLQDHFDAIVARNVIMQSKNQLNNDKFESLHIERINPVIYEGNCISDVVNKTFRKEQKSSEENSCCTKDISRVVQATKQIHAIWLNYIDGKVYNARDLRQSKYWKDLNSILEITISPKADTLEDTTNLLISITINYSNDSEYWEGAAVDWLVEGVHEAILSQYQVRCDNQIKDKFIIKVLRVATYAVGVPRLFVALHICLFGGERESNNHIIERKDDINSNSSQPEVAHWQWHTEWNLMHDLLLKKRDEFNSFIYPNPHLPSPATDRFRRVSPVICGLIKYIMSIKESLNGYWWTAKENVNHNLETGSKYTKHNSYLKLFLYEDGFQHVCPAILNLNRKSKRLLKDAEYKDGYPNDDKHSFKEGNAYSQPLQISCCSEDPLQIRFLNEFALSSLTCHKTQLNVIKLPDRDIKHLNKNCPEGNQDFSDDLFVNHDCLILLIQGGCKRWKEMFCPYIRSWMEKLDKEYRESLKNQKEKLGVPVASISMMFELAQGMDEIFTLIRNVVSKYNWAIHIDEPVNIYNTSRTSLFITCLLAPADAVCQNDAYLNSKTINSIDTKSKNRVVEATNTDVAVPSSSETLIVPLQEKVRDKWLSFRKQLLQSVVGKG